MGSVSKQFTAASVVLAAEQGYLSLDDDIHKYIPELLDYVHPVTLRQMLHQTSGFRDFFDLIALSGRDPGNVSPTEILKLITRQKGLNNVPGRSGSTAIQIISCSPKWSSARQKCRLHGLPPKTFSSRSG